MTSQPDAPEPNPLTELRAEAAALRALLGRLPDPRGAVPARSAHDLTRVLAERDRRADALQHEADARLRIIAEQAEQIRGLEEQLRVVQAAADERLALLQANHRSHEAFRARVRERLRDLLDLLPE
jgi:hypothetical protein